VVVGLLDHLDAVNNVFVFKRSSESIHDLFASARAVGVSDAKGSVGRHVCWMNVFAELCIKRYRIKRFQFSVN
jgi:hypothetical protein